MSAANNNIPFDIQAEIIKRVLPVKSLIRFRSVSKQWKSLIGSSEFITEHSVNRNHPHHLLVLERHEVVSNYKYVSIVDDDSFPKHKFSPVIPDTVKLVIHAYALILDSSYGLVFVYGYHYAPSLKNISKLAVVWNPSIRKSVGVVLPHVFTAVGFVVCPKTSEPKIITITRITDSSQINTIDWKAEVFTLSSTGAWRSIPMNIQLPLKELTFYGEQVVIDGVIHMVAYDASTRLSDMIVSFFSTSEEFAKVDLPDCLVHRTLSIYKLKESLAVVDWDRFEMICDVWMIKNGDLNSSFTKLLTVSCVANIIIGFRKNGQLIREQTREDGDDSLTTLEVYEPYTQHINDLGFDAASDSYFRMTSYTESLLLLNHSDSIIHG